MIYIDNAATSFPKPACMQKELNRCISEYCGNPGRSGHYFSQKAAEKIFECRETLTAFFNGFSPEKVIFTANTTHALNLAIKTLYVPESHVLISNMEHNSVFRPIFSLKEEKNIRFDVFNVLQSEEKIIQEIKNKIKSETSMVVMTHASNICGKVFPIKQIGKLCKEKNIIFIVDAAQSAGIIPINIKEMNIDALCLPAHKGLYGPQGLGAVIFGDITPIRTIIEGGNGVNSFNPKMGNDLPECLEAGTIATPLIAALDASVKWVRAHGVNEINSHEIELATKLIDRLSSICGSTFYGDESLESGIVLYTNSLVSLGTLTHHLNRNGICTRSGIHCAPLAHSSLGTPGDGAIRISFGVFNTIKDVDATYKCIKELII